jgi:hypothetical protein
MNRFKALLLTTALMAGSSALASAQDYHYNGVGAQLRISINEGQHFRGGHPYYGYRDGDRDDRHYNKADRDDHRGRDRDDRWRRGDDDRQARGWDRD